MAWLRPFALAALALAAACNTPAPERGDAAPLDPALTATISGRVVVDGPVPPAGTLRIDGDRHCVTITGGDEIADESVLVGDGMGLANAFVYVGAGLEKHAFPVPAEPSVLDRQTCRYVPRVLGVRVGQPLEVRNSDPLLHNVRAEGEINQPFNIGQPVQGTMFSRTFTTREVMVPFTCDVHAWMRAYVGVLEHPHFAVTTSTGAFELKGLPPGEYTVEAWHEQLGVRAERVSVEAGDVRDVGFTFAR